MVTIIGNVTPLLGPSESRGWRVTFGYHGHHVRESRTPDGRRLGLGLGLGLGPTSKKKLSEKHIIAAGTRLTPTEY